MIDPKTLSLSRERLIEFVQQQLDWAKSCLDDREPTSWTPAFAVLNRPWSDGTVGKEELALCFLAVPFNEDHEKYPAIENLGRQFYAKKTIPILVCAVTETWRSKRRDCKPADDPDREEGLSVFGATFGCKEVVVGWIPVFRRNGKMIPGKPELYAEGKSGSAILEAFFNGWGRDVVNKFVAPTN